jgi:arsenate reductase
MKILFMCVANSARSQVAEGLAKAIFGSSHEIQSAGSIPFDHVNPGAIVVLNEIGIDASKQYSKRAQDLPPEFLASLDLLITLCAEESCPVLASKAKKLHWPLPDPAHVGEPGSEARLHAFRAVREELKKRLERLKTELGL